MKVLIIGFETGTWLLDMAEKFRASNVYICLGDASEFPDDESRLSNTGFIKCDFLYGIPFDRSTFDVILNFVDSSSLSEFQNDNFILEVDRVLKQDGLFVGTRTDLDEQSVFIWLRYSALGADINEQYLLAQSFRLGIRTDKNERLSAEGVNTDA
ncbi:2602_t:CDS:2 [Funneliformis geosporum]|nr:2602_t:CDS:2 [Funneliformis geosporum]